MRLAAFHARLPNALVAVPCAVIAMVFLASIAFSTPELDVPRGGQWLTLAIFGSTAIWCGKSALAPSLVCAADDVGVTVGKGIFKNTTRAIPWSDVLSIEKAVLVVEHVHSDRKNTSSKHPAIRFHFRPGIGLGSVGFSLGHPDSPDTFIVAASLFRRSQTQLLATLEAMQRRAQT